MDRNATARLGSSASVLVCLRLGIHEDRIRGRQFLAVLRKPRSLAKNLIDFLVNGLGFASSVVMNVGAEEYIRGTVVAARWQPQDGLSQGCTRGASSDLYLECSGAIWSPMTPMD
jgi:hypothetical protein